jgi:tripartite-type tricarboxylate transporter receptor subunit TctC
VARAAKDPEVRARMREQGSEPVGNTPAQFNRILREESERWSEVVRVSGARAD